MLFQPIPMFMGKARAYLMELFGAPLLALPAKMRVGWESVPGTNVLAYYKNSQLQP
jgi:hypothetical protein